MRELILTIGQGD